MKIALINENSQNSKNPMIEAALKKVVEPMGHTVFNYGMYADADSKPLTYVQNGILAAVLLVVSLTGVFSNTAQKFGQSLTIQKHNTTSALAGQMDQLTAQSIALSEELTRELDKQLAAGGRTFSALNDDPGAIAAVETALYPALNTYLKSSACSGAVFCLDATANTALPGAATSRAGLYLRYSALRAIGATDQHVTCFRGAAETARYALRSVIGCILRTTEAARKAYPGLPVVFSGGVASNTLLRQVLEPLNPIFAQPQYSTDNAMGIAVLTWLSENGYAE